MAVQVVETRQVAIAHLTRYPGNARRGDVEEIRASIARYGQYRALVVRDTGEHLVVLAGNHTRDAMEAEGHTTARCEILRCTDDEALRINLADNRLAELGSYDDHDLASLLRGLDGDFEGTGWAESDLATLATLVTTVDEETPTEFPEFGDDIDTEHTCPKCGYEWSGKT